jgi:hypothetical protein
VEAQIQSQAGVLGMCSGQSGPGTGFSLNASIFHFTNA